MDLGRLRAATLAACLAAAGACNTTLQNHPIASRDELLKAEEGIPWVETRQYDVYVFQAGKPAAGPCTDADGNRIACAPPVAQLYYGRHELLDEVSGKVIDPSRRRWQTNYEARTFSDGTLLLEFDELGALKKAQLTGTPGLTDAAKAANVAAGLPESIEKEELARKKRELETLQTEKSLREARQALDAAP